MNFRKLSLSICLLLGVASTFAQDYNNNRNIGAINHDVPKSPESASFEKYGKIPVGEFSGTASVNVPLYTLQNKYISLPIALSYHASGIKVSQEATWVGLGWDLVPGGRVTLQIRGGYDKYSDQYYGTHGPESQAMMNFIYAQAATYNTQSAIVWACSQALDYIPSVPPPERPESGFDSYCGYWATRPDFLKTDLNNFLHDCAKYGVMEPDIYNVNFLGRSLSFYKQPFTNKIIVIGESNLYKVEEIDALGSGWRITDDQGVQFVFSKEEKTYYRTPLSGVYPYITTSWLLTQIVEPSGEGISFTYSNEGPEYPAPTISESETTVTAALPNDPVGIQNNTNKNNNNDVFYVYPQYLTKIESKNSVITFNLGYRDDIGGLGARKLDGIVVRDKTSNEPVRHIQFQYEYLVSSVAGEMHINPDLHNVTSHGTSTAADRFRTRLNLKAVKLGGTDSLSFNQTYRFIYNPLLLPNKVSVSQDHWGYYNGQSNLNSATSIAFTPTLTSLAEEGIISYPYPQGTDLMLSGHANRKADEASAQAAMLKSVIYPTGGYSIFEYELHRSNMNMNANFLGGGLRIKSIANFSGTNEVESIKHYSYTNDNNANSGIYMGAIDYLYAEINYEFFWEGNNFGGWGPGHYGLHDRVTRTLFSNGNLNKAGINVGYGQVTVKNIDYKKGTSFSTVKQFNVHGSWPAMAHGTGSQQPGLFIASSFLHLPPTPDTYLHAKLIQEKELDDNGQVVQVTTNSYSQHMITDNFASIKVTDGSMLKDKTWGSYYFTFEPVRTYYTTLDSTVTSTKAGSQNIISKKEIKYNNFFQPEQVITSSSDEGTVTEYTTTPLSYASALPALPGLTSQVQGNAAAIQRMRIKNMVNLPIEKLTTKKLTNAEHVIKGTYLNYDDLANITEIYHLETDNPILMGQFQRSVYNPSQNYDLIRDPRYQLRQDAIYYPFANYLKQFRQKEQLQSFIVDRVNDHVLAIANNAHHNDIAFTSFESTETGNWTLEGGNVNNGSAHTGTKSYNLTGGSTITSTISTAGDYLVSYWLSSGAVSVNGTLGTAVEIKNGWTNYEHRITVNANANIQLIGTGSIDELRLHPYAAHLTSYTYKPLVGMTSTTDPKSLTTYYDFDNYGLLKHVRDDKRNIIKSYSQHLADHSAVVPGGIFLSKAIHVMIPKVCPTGQLGSTVPYDVPAHKYYSFVSQEDADQQAQAEVNANGQTNANNLGTCTVQETFSFQYQLPSYTSFTVTFYNSTTNQSFYHNLSGSGTVYDLPVGTYNISINEVNYQGIFDYILFNTIQSGMFVHFENITFTTEGTGSGYLYAMEVI